MDLRKCQKIVAFPTMVCNITKVIAQFRPDVDSDFSAANGCNRSCRSDNVAYQTAADPKLK
jgi:hypothetical protein